MTETLDKEEALVDGLKSLISKYKSYVA